MDVFQKGLEKVKGAARTLRHGKKSTHRKTDLLCGNTSKPTPFQSQEETFFSDPETKLHKKPENAENEEESELVRNKESTFQINQQVGTFPEESKFDKAELGGIFSPLKIELMFKPSDENVDTSNSEGRNTINRLLWGQDNIPDTINSFERELISYSFAGKPNSNSVIFHSKDANSTISKEPSHSQMELDQDNWKTYERYENTGRNSLSELLLEERKTAHRNEMSSYSLDLNPSTTEAYLRRYQEQPSDLVLGLSLLSDKSIKDDVSLLSHHASVHQSSKKSATSNHEGASFLEKVTLDPNSNFNPNNQFDSDRSYFENILNLIEGNGPNGIDSHNEKINEIYESSFSNVSEQLSDEKTAGINSVKFNNCKNIQSVQQNSLIDNSLSSVPSTSQCLYSAPIQPSVQSGDIYQHKKSVSATQFISAEQKISDTQSSSAKPNKYKKSPKVDFTRSPRPSLFSKRPYTLATSVNVLSEDSKESGHQKYNMFLITQGDFSTPLPDKIGNMVLDKTINQWVDVSEQNTISPQHRPADLVINNGKKHTSAVAFKNQSHTDIAERFSTAVSEDIDLDSDNLPASPIYDYSEIRSAAANMFGFGLQANNTGSIEKKQLYSIKNKSVNDIFSSNGKVYRYNSLNTRNKQDSVRDHRFQTTSRINNSRNRDSYLNGSHIVSPLRPRPINTMLNLSEKEISGHSKLDIGNKNAVNVSLPSVNIENSFYDESSSRLLIDSYNFSSLDKRSETRSKSSFIFDDTESNQGEISLSHIGLPKDHYSTLTAVDLKNLGIRSLRGLSDFLPDLEHLNVNNNKISQVIGIPKTTVSLQAKNNWFSFGNNPDALICKYLPHLEYIDLSENQISDIRIFSGLLHLRTLILSQNQIKSLKGLKQCRRIKNLDVAGNLLKRFDLDSSQLTGLEDLNLSNNRLVALDDIDCLTKLRKLNLENNDICSWEIRRPMEWLETLNLSKNPNFLRLDNKVFGESMLIRFFPALRFLALDDCYITDFGSPSSHQDHILNRSFQKNTRTFVYNKFNLLGNQTSNDYFSKSKSGTLLQHFKGDNQSYKEYLQMDSGPGTLEHLSILGNSKTRNSTLSVNFNQLINLKTLQISNRRVQFNDINQICSPRDRSSLCNLPPLSSLSTLNLTNCNISQLPDNIGFALPSLEVLNVSLNPRLHFLPDSINQLKSLKSIRCQFTALGCPCSIPKDNILSGMNHTCRMCPPLDDFSAMPQPMGNSSFDLKKLDPLMSSNTAVNDTTTNSTLWASQFTNQIKDLSQLEELDLRGCPLTKYAYSPLDEDADFILPRLRLDKRFDRSRPSNHKHLLHASFHSINIEKDLFSNELPEDVKDAFLYQVESLGVCDSEILRTENSQDWSSSPESYNNNFDSRITAKNMAQESPTQPISGVNNSAVLQVDDTFGPNFYRFTSELSLKEIDEWAKTDIAFLTWISTTFIGYNIIAWRIFYRNLIMSRLPNLKWLDGIECTD